MLLFESTQFEDRQKNIVKLFLRCESQRERQRRVPQARGWHVYITTEYAILRDICNILFSQIVACYRQIFLHIFFVTKHFVQERTVQRNAVVEHIEVYDFFYYLTIYDFFYHLYCLVHRRKFFKQIKERKTRMVPHVYRTYDTKIHVFVYNIYEYLSRDKRNIC